MSTVNSSKPEVSICKEILWRQLNSNSDLAHLSKEENQIKSRLKDAFDRRVSTSILVVGPTGSGKRELVEKVMIDYCSEGINSSSPISVARINGLVHLNDNQAIISLADQLLLRPSSYDRNVNIANEDLENHFKQCRFDCQPAVIIVEELQEFSKREKQVLIYTLLDLMHREDLLFVLIGTTKSADVNYLLEKRVLSRFSAQFVYIPPSNATDICAVLSTRLTLPEEIKCFESNDSSTKRRVIDNSSIKERYSKYRDKFNKHIQLCLGVVSAANTGLSSSGAGSGGVNSKAASKDLADQSDDECDVITSSSSRSFERGSLYDDILCLVEDGSSLKHFLKAAQMAVTLLSSESDLISAQMFQDCLHQAERPGLAARLNGLSEVELNLAAAIARVRMRISGYTGSSSSSTSSSSAGGVTMRGEKGKGGAGNSKNLRNITVDDAMSEFHRLSSVVARKILPEEYVKAALLTLVMSGIIVLSNGFDEGIPRDLVTTHTVIEFLPAEHEFEAAFRRGYLADSWQGQGPGQSKGAGASDSAAQDSHGNPALNNNGKRVMSSSSISSGSAPILRVTGRVRRAVLNPQEQVLMEGSIAIM